MLTYLVLVIPPWLLWKVKISLRQKIGIGSFLCLSLIMIIIAVIRISRVHANDFNIWAPFLQQLEACVAVLMLSLTALRTLYVSAKRTQEQQRNKKIYSSRKHLWPSSKKLQDEPYIQLDMPSATLTGMRTLIASNQSTSWPTKHEDSQDLDPRFDNVSLSIWFLSGMTKSSLNPPFRYDPQPSTMYKVSEGRLQVHEIMMTSLPKTNLRIPNSLSPGSVMPLIRWRRLSPCLESFDCPDDKICILSQNEKIDQDRLTKS